MNLGDSMFGGGFLQEIDSLAQEAKKLGEQQRIQMTNVYGSRTAMKSPYYIPQYNDSDSRFRFRKPNWEQHLWFTWDVRAKGYRYMNGSVPSHEVLTCGQLEIYPMKGTKIMSSRNVDYIGTDYEVVKVTYELNADDMPGLENAYYFKTSIKLKEGDLVVVESSNGLGIVRVLEDSEVKSLDVKVVKKFNKAKAWVVDMVNMVVHNKRKEATERKKFILQELAERKEAVEEVAIYKMLAESDPAAAKLLKELEDLS